MLGEKINSNYSRFIQIAAKKPAAKTYTRKAATCQICGKIVRDAYGLGRHMRNKHHSEAGPASKVGPSSKDRLQTIKLSRE